MNNYSERRGFASFEEMKNFLQEMKEDDNWIENVPTKEIRTEFGEIYVSGQWYLFYEEAIPSFERRSGDTAIGHNLMTPGQIIKSINQYWELHPEKEKSTVLVRGDKVLLVGSDQYVYIPQVEVFSMVNDYLEDHHSGKYAFRGGSYSIEKSAASFALADGITDRFRRDWKNSGLSERSLDNAVVLISVYSSDTAKSSARLFASLKLRNAEMALGQPVMVAHRKSRNKTAISEFQKKLTDMDTMISDEFKRFSDLMSVTIYEPHKAMRRAMKKSGMMKVSKKACRELDESTAGMNGTETAFTLYMTLHAVLDTSFGKKFSEEQKWEMTMAIHSLVNEDWKNFDKSGEVEL